MRVATGARLSTRPATLGLLTGLGGLMVAGVVGAVVGIVGGVAAARRPQSVLVAAATALIATAAFTVLEQPLAKDNMPGFPLSHPRTEVSAKVAAVLLLAGLGGIVGSGGRARRFHLTRTASRNLPSTGPRTTARVPLSTIAALAGAALLATLTLWQIGDRRWEGAAPAVAMTVVTLAAVFAAVDRWGWRVPLRLESPMPGPAAILDGLRRSHAHMLVGSTWLVAGTLVVSLGSFIFWLLVAQRVPADDVGGAAALFGATLFVCYLTSLGLPIALSRYAPDRTQSSATLFAWSLALTMASSLAGVVVLAALAPGSIRDALAAWPPGLAWLMVFLLVLGLSVSALVDVRLMTLRRWSLVFVRALLTAALRLPFVLWVPDTGTALYVYLVAAGGFAITGVAFLLPLAYRDRVRFRPVPARAGRAIAFAGVNYLGHLAVQAPFFAVPFVVLIQVDAVENARFYLSWGVMTVVYISIQAIAQVLLVEGGRGGADHRRQAKVALGAGLAVAASATLLSLGFGSVLATLYGPSYGPIATLLPLLVAGTIPFTLVSVLLTTARIRENSYSTIALTVTFAAAVLVPTMLLTAGHGAFGAAWGWTMGNTIAAALALLASRLFRRGRSARVLRPDAAISSVTAVPGRQQRPDPRG